MFRLISTELASIGRRMSAELEITTPSSTIRDALQRLGEAETAARIRSGPNALRINGYL